MQLKRWESPRRQGRNDKGKGGAARKRQLKKQQQMLRKRLKEENNQNNNKKNKQGERKLNLSPFFLTSFYLMTNKIYFIYRSKITNLVYLRIKVK
ncbi:MAG: hypothetical protein WBA41_22090 [Rivularia sp. (in: cyanobacteria)]